MSLLRRAHVVVLVALSIAITACADVPPPTKEEAAAALGELELDEIAEAWMRALDSKAAPGAASSPAGAASAPSAPGAASAAPKAGTPRRLPVVTVDDMTCEKVEKKTYDCQVAWRSLRATRATTARYRFVRGPEKWTARKLVR